MPTEQFASILQPARPMAHSNLKETAQLRRREPGGKPVRPSIDTFATSSGPQSFLLLNARAANYFCLCPDRLFRCPDLESFHRSLRSRRTEPVAPRYSLRATAVSLVMFCNRMRP